MFFGVIEEVYNNEFMIQFFIIVEQFCSVNLPARLPAWLLMFASVYKHRRRKEEKNRKRKKKLFFLLKTKQIF